MNEQHENDKTEERKDKEVGPRRPLLRSRDDRKIWGVAGGLAEHLGFNPTLVRIFFVVTLFFGGAGAARLPGAGGRPARRRRNRPAGARERLVAARQGGAGLRPGRRGALPRGRPRRGSAWVTATGHGTVIAIAVIVFGLGLVAAAFAGDIRRRIVPLLRGRRRSCWGSRRQRSPPRTSRSTSRSASAHTRPTTAADIPSDGYKLGTGQLVVDLRSCPGRRARRSRSRPISGSGR